MIIRSRFRVPRRRSLEPVEDRLALSVDRDDPA
jgi:hypothetical protein